MCATPRACGTWRRCSLSRDGRFTSSIWPAEGGPRRYPTRRDLCRPADDDGTGFVDGFGDAGAVLDDTAKDAYRRRLTELDELIVEAERFNDIERASQLGVERDMLVDQLAQAVGLGGRDRRAVSVSERARVNVTRAIRSAIRRIGEVDRDAGHYLDATVVTGTFCVFDPQRSS